MTNQQLLVYINVLSATETITPLQKDILDTWHELRKNPFDKDSAQKQIVSNNVNHPDILIAIQISPDVVQKPFDEATPKDLVFNLKRQLEGLVSKEMRASINGKEK